MKKETQKALEDLKKAKREMIKEGKVITPELTEAIQMLERALKKRPDKPLNYS